MCGKAEQYLYNKRQSENREREKREMVVVVMMMMMMMKLSEGGTKIESKNEIVPL